MTLGTKEGGAWAALLYPAPSYPPSGLGSLSGCKCRAQGAKATDPGQADLPSLSKEVQEAGRSHRKAGAHVPGRGRDDCRGRDLASLGRCWP